MPTSPQATRIQIVNDQDQFGQLLNNIESIIKKIRQEKHSVLKNQILEKPPIKPKLKEQNQIIYKDLLRSRSKKREKFKQSQSKPQSPSQKSFIGNQQYIEYKNKEIVKFKERVYNEILQQRSPEYKGTTKIVLSELGTDHNTQNDSVTSQSFSHHNYLHDDINRSEFSQEFTLSKPIKTPLNEKKLFNLSPTSSTSTMDERFKSTRKNHLRCKTKVISLENLKPDLKVLKSSNNTSQSQSNKIVLQSNNDQMKQRQDIKQTTNSMIMHTKHQSCSLKEIQYQDALQKLKNSQLNFKRLSETNKPQKTLASQIYEDICNSVEIIDSTVIQSGENDELEILKFQKDETLRLNNHIEVRVNQSSRKHHQSNQSSMNNIPICTFKEKELQQNLRDQKESTVKRRNYINKNDFSLESSSYMGSYVLPAGTDQSDYTNTVKTINFDAFAKISSYVIEGQDIDSLKIEENLDNFDVDLKCNQSHTPLANASKKRGSVEEIGNMKELSYFINQHPLLNIKNLMK